MRNSLHIKKRKITEKEFEISKNTLRKKHNLLLEKQNKQGARFHGSPEKNLISIRRQGLKTNRGNYFIYLGVPGETLPFAGRGGKTGKGFSVIHAVDKNFLKKRRTSVFQSKFMGDTNILDFEIPPEKLTTFILNTNIGKDPLVLLLEKKAKRERKENFRYLDDRRGRAWF